MLQGKSFFFRNFSSVAANQDFTIGSTTFELRPKDVSLVEATKNDMEFPLDKSNFFAFLKEKHALSSDFSPVAITSVKEGEIMMLVFLIYLKIFFSDLQGELLRVKEIRKVMSHGNESKVLDMELIQNGAKYTVTAWSLLAEMLFVHLSGKEVFDIFYI